MVLMIPRSWVEYCVRLFFPPIFFLSSFWVRHFFVFFSIQFLTSIFPPPPPPPPNTPTPLIGLFFPSSIFSFPLFSSPFFFPPFFSSSFFLPFSTGMGRSHSHYLWHTGLITLGMVGVGVGTSTSWGHPQVGDIECIFNLWLQLTGFTEWESNQKVVNHTTTLPSSLGPVEWSEWENYLFNGIEAFKTLAILPVSHRSTRAWNNRGGDIRVQIWQIRPDKINF